MHPTENGIGTQGEKWTVFSMGFRSQYN
jgi:hypothetical protein